MTSGPPWETESISPWWFTQTSLCIILDFRIIFRRKKWCNKTFWLNFGKSHTTRSLSGLKFTNIVLWNKKWELPYFHETMSRVDFHVILKYIRFDMKTTRDSRLQTDKFALISEIWNLFIENSQSNYWWTVISNQSSLSFYSIYIKQT